MFTAQNASVETAVAARMNKVERNDFMLRIARGYLNNSGG